MNRRRLIFAGFPAALALAPLGSTAFSAWGFVIEAASSALVAVAGIGATLGHYWWRGVESSERVRD